MSDEMQSEEEHIQLSPRDIGLGIGTFLAFGGIDMIGHYGLGGWVLGSMAGIAAAYYGGDLIDMVKSVKAALPHRQEMQVLPSPRIRQRLPQQEVRLSDEPMHTYEDVWSEVAEPSLPDAPFSSCPPDQQLRLGKVVSTGHRFDPPINNLLGKGMIIAGAQESGKSNLTGLCGTFAGRCYMSVVVIDLKGEFYPLIETVPNGIRVGHPSFSDEAGPGYYPLTEETAQDVAVMIMEQGFQAIVHVPSYQDGDEVALVVAALLNALMDWSQAQQEEDRLPCLVMTDEAHNFVPQNPSISALRMHTDSFNALQSAYSRMCNTGRSYGYTMVMATQRIANIAKWAIANLQIKVIMRHAEKNDLDRCEQEVGADVADRNVVKALSQGTGIVVGLTPEPVTVKFDKQPARHVSNTPSIERAHQRFRHAPKRPLPPMEDLTPNPTKYPTKYEDSSSRSRDILPGGPRLRLIHQDEVNDCVNEPVKSREQHVNVPDSAEKSVNVPEVSPEEEAQILAAAFKVAEESQGKVTRTGIRNKLEWNNRQYPKIMLVCDKFKIAI